MLWLYDQPSVSGLFNVGSGTARSFKDLATAVFEAAGQRPRIEYVDTPAEIRDKYHISPKHGWSGCAPPAMPAIRHARGRRAPLCPGVSDA
ncbi:MAG: hypothetical protein WDO24_00695 [Pseudomonadota bacterium]